MTVGGAAVFVFVILGSTAAHAVCKLHYHNAVGTYPTSKSPGWQHHNTTKARAIRRARQRWQRRAKRHDGVRYMKWKKSIKQKTQCSKRYDYNPGVLNKKPVVVGPYTVNWTFIWQCSAAARPCWI